MAYDSLSASYVLTKLIHRAVFGVLVLTPERGGGGLRAKHNPRRLGRCYQMWTTFLVVLSTTTG